MKRSVVGVLIGVLLIVTGLNPQSGMAVSFATPVDYGDLGFAYHISLGDLNRDGKTDMVVAGAGGSDVGILFGNGAGSFTRTNITAGQTPVRTGLADINQDGKLDIISANYTSNTISVFLGDGAGGFTPKMDFVTGDNGPYFVAAGDINRDGKPDLAVAHFGELSTTVSILINATSAGSTTVSFETPSSLTIGGRQWSIALGDLNLDGKLDLAVGSESNGLLIFFGDGTGSFSAPSVISISALDVKIADINSDGKPDLALAAGGNTAGVLLGNGTGGFASLVPFDVGSQALGVDVGDLNGDGKLDLAVSCRDTGLSVLLGNGLGGFPARQDFATGSTSWSVAIADFNRDGKADAAVANELSSNLSVLLNITAFPASGTLVSGTALDIGSRQWGLALGDLNLDGHPDLAVGSESSGLQVYFGDGAGGFSTPTALGVSALDIKISDVNADGKPDLVAANGGAQVGVLLGDGTGGFASIVQFAVGSQALGVDVGDLNGDGKLDLAVSCRDTGLSILLGDGLGGFPTRQDIATGNSSWSVAIADFNRDGRADLVVANELSPSVSVLLGDGTGGFLPQTDYDAVPFPYHVAVADLDLDGDLDFVVGSAGSTNIAVFKGDSSGGFARSVLTVGQTPARVATCDLNRDGVPDILAANYTSGTISVLAGDGFGGFGSSVDYSGADGGPYFIGIGDLNTDGKPDLVVAYFGGAATHASIYLNSPAQVLVTGTVLAGGSPVPNVVMTGLPGSPVTNSSGVYQGLVNPGWSGTVTPTLASYTFEPASRAYTAITSNQTGQDYAATLFVTHYTISGTVTLGATGLAGVVMGGLPGNPITDSQGHYAASVESGFTATVTPALPGFTFAPASRTYSALGADATGENYASTYVGGVDDAYEENDTQATAAIIPLGTTRGLVLNDEEWFKFYVPAEDAGKDLKVRLWATAFPDGTSNSDPMIGKDLDFGILNASGKLLNYALSGSADETAYICNAAEGWYTIVDNYVGIPGTVYAISIELSDAFGLSYISGTVTAEGGGAIDGASVELYWEGMEWNQPHPLVFTDSDGHYKLGWAPGNYTVRFNFQDFADNLTWTPDLNYLPELYHGGETVVVGPGVSLTGIDGELTPGGVISGRVTDADGNPLNQAIVNVYTADAVRTTYVYTDVSGNYAIRRIRAANYAIRFRAPNGTPWANEWYENRSSLADCLPVAVAAGATTANVDASLSTGGYIHGHVSNAAGDPVQSVQVTALDPSGISLWSVPTNASGEYVIGNIPPGSFKIFFNATNAAGGFLASEYYPDKRLVGDAVPVTVTLGQTTDGIDAQLSDAGIITGRITDVAGNGVGRVSVIAFDTASDFTSGANPDYAGYFNIRSLPPGTYRLLARPAFANGDKAPKWYADALSYGAADSLLITAGGTASGVNIVLDETGGSISGRVTDGLGAGIAGLPVVAQDSSKANVNYASIGTDANGYYTIPRVPAGSVKVLFNADAPYLGYVSEYYNDKSSHAGADAVIVSSGETTPAVNAVLAARPALDITTVSLPNAEFALPYSQSLALTGGRSFYHWAVTSGALPEGLTLNARGEITGTPTVEGTFPFTVQASDSSAPQQMASKSLSITVGAYSGFGFTITGTVTAGGSPLASVVLSGLPGSPVTNAAGHYAISVDPAWSGTVTPVLAGRFFDPVDRTYTTVTANLTGQDYTAAAGYTIAGRVTFNGANQANVLLSGLPGATRTDATGAYSASVPAGWSGTVTPIVPGFTFAPADRTYSAMAANATAQDYTSSYSGGVDDAYEDNDSFATAAILPLGTTTDLVLRDADWFKVYVPAGGPGRVLKVRLRATAFPDGTCYTDPNVGKDLDFGVLDASGKMLTFNLSGSADETAYIPDVTEGWYTISQMYVGFEGAVYSLTAEVSDAYPIGYVSGTIKDEGGQGIEGVCVELYEEPFDWNISRPLVATDASGRYKIAYTPGSYTVRFNITDFADDQDWTPEVNYIGKLYNYGAVIALSPAAPLTNIDGVLSLGGTISGRVIDASGNPLFQAQVRAYAGDMAQWAFSYTDGTGNYVLHRLRPANYAISFRAPGSSSMAREWFDDQRSFAAATPVVVAAGVTTAGVNAVLDVGGSISGHVTDAAGNPVQGVQAMAYDASGIALQAGTTNASGDYFIGRLPSGGLKVYFNAATSGAGNYVSEYYPDQRFIADAGLVPVVLGQTTSGIDAQLAAAGAIAGRVTDGNGQAMPYAPVACFDTASDLYVTATADLNGNYEVRNVPPGQYKVRLKASYGEWTLKWFDGKPSFAAGEAVTVAAGATVANVNASLAVLAGSISGRVTDGFGSGIAGVTVQALDISRVAGIYSVSTDADGYYTIGRVPPGSAKVFFSADASYLNFVSEFYSDKTGHGSADAVTVASGETTPGIDAVLASRPALTVTTASLPAGQLAVAYSVALAGSGGRTFYHWSIESGVLPDGMAMNGRGEISGIPTLAGTFDFTVKLTDSTSPQQQAARLLSITVGTYMGVGYAISGKILFGGQPLGGVVMSGLPGSPTTNASGGYVGIVQDGWWGTVTPTLQGYYFTPPNRIYSNVTASQENQDFTATDVIPSSITVTAPNGGESWAAGSNHNVTWTQTGLTGSVTIDLYKGGVYQKTLGTPDATLGTFAWVISLTETPGPDYRIRIRQASVSDESNANFAIEAAVVRKDDLIGTWDNQGVYYKNSDTGGWVQMASPASMVTCGDLDNDGTEDLIGIWPGQGGVWVKYSSTGGWAYIASTAVHITSGDMNGDGRDGFLGTWDGQGVYYRNSQTGAWVLMASPASMITSGDLDNDGTDDLIGIWPGQGGVWVKYSSTGNWAYIASTAQWIGAGDMNGDGRDELLGTWDGQGVYYRNSETGAWVLMASPATMITSGDLDGDGTDDLIGLWPAQGGIWVKHSTTGAWELLSSTAQYICAGKMRPGSGPAPAVVELPLPMGGIEPGPEGAALKTDESSKGPGGRRFVYTKEKNLKPKQRPLARLKRVPGPGSFRLLEQNNRA